MNDQPSDRKRWFLPRLCRYAWHEAPSFIRWIVAAHLGFAVAIAWGLYRVVELIALQNAGFCSVCSEWPDWMRSVSQGDTLDGAACSGVLTDGSTGGAIAICVSIAIACSFVSCVAIGPLVLALQPDRKRSPWFVHGVIQPFHAHICAVLASQLAWPLGIGASLISGRWTDTPAWVLAGYVVSFAVFLWGAWVTTARLRVKCKPLAMPGFPPAFVGLRIAHLSDLHVGSFTSPERIARWLAKLRKTPFDVAVITGDLISSGQQFHYATASVIASLECPLGVFVVSGNHEVGPDAEPLMTLLREKGIYVLHNESVTVNYHGEPLAIAGVQDIATGQTNLRASLGSTHGLPVVLLAHNPSVFSDAAEQGVALTMSGHTHGGQIAVPLLARWLNLTRMTQPYTLGIYRRGQTTLVVSGGMGCTGLAIRVGVVPEITIWEVSQSPESTPNNS